MICFNIIKKKFSDNYLELVLSTGWSITPESDLYLPNKVLLARIFLLFKYTSATAPCVVGGYVLKLKH